MRCPDCLADDTRVIDSRPADEGTAIRRRRMCEACDARFTTYERSDRTLMVRKRSGTLEPFDSAKLSAGVGAALADRPTSATQVSTLVSEVEAALNRSGRIVESDEIGRRVLESLRSVDEVAYLRFASVYKEFQGTEDFEREMAAKPSGSPMLSPSSSTVSSVGPSSSRSDGTGGRTRQGCSSTR